MQRKVAGYDWGSDSDKERVSNQGKKDKGSAMASLVLLITQRKVAYPSSFATGNPIKVIEGTGE